MSDYGSQRSRSRGGRGGRGKGRGHDQAKEKPPPDNRKVVTISAFMSNDKLELLRKEWPQYNIRNGELVNEHAYLNADRELATIFSRSRTVGRVKHVGGRLQLLSPGDHSCNPIIKPSDVFRRNAPKGVVEWGPESSVQPTAKTFCDCRVEACACRYVPRSFVAVHSIYDFNSMQIAALIGTKERRLYSYVHRFVSARGTTPFKEASWEIFQRNGEDWVNFVVRGASAPYEHPAMTWLWNSEDTMVTMPDGSEMTLVWRVLLSNTLGGLIEFALTNPIWSNPKVDETGGTIDRFKEFRDKTLALKATSDYLSSAISVFSSHDADAATYARVSCVGGKVTADMLGIRVSSSEVNLLLPIELLKYATQKCAGMQRTPAAFGLLVTYVREKSHEINLGAGDPGQTIFGTAAVAFTKNVRFESELMKLLYLPYVDRVSETISSNLLGFSFPKWMKDLVVGKKVTFSDHSRLRNFDFNTGDHITNWWDRNSIQVADGWKIAGTALAISAGTIAYQSLSVLRGGKMLPGMSVDGAICQLSELYKSHDSGKWLQMSTSKIAGLISSDLKVEWVLRLPTVMWLRTRTSDAVTLVRKNWDMVMQQVRGKFSKQEINIVVAYAPIVEETFKRLTIGKWSLRWPLYVYEAVVVYKCNPYYLPTLFMHECAYRLPVIPGMLLHSAWNLRVLYLTSGTVGLLTGALGIVGTNGLLMAGTLLEGIGHLSATHPVTSNQRVVEGDVTVTTSCHVASTGRTLDKTNPADVLGETEMKKPIFWFSGKSTMYKTCRWSIPDKVCAPTFGCRLVGIGLVTHAPCILRSCVCNEVIGIRQRMWAPVPWRGENFIPVAVNVIEHNMMVSMYRDACPLSFGGKVRAYGFDEWVKRFPSGTRRELLRAKQDLDNGLVPSRVFEYKAFLKRERLPLSFIGKELSTPRIIQGLGFHARVITGPWFAAYGDRVKEVMRISPERLLCTAMGSSAESVGGWLRNALDVVPDPIILAVDQSKWDAHLHPEFLAARVYLYEALGAPKAVLEFCKQRIVANGRTISGVRYGTVGTVHSGDGDTSAGNNIDHGMLWLRLLARGADAMHHDACNLAGKPDKSAMLEIDEILHASLEVRTGLATTSSGQGCYGGYTNPSVMRAGKQFRVLVMGDDGVIVMSRALLGKLGEQEGIREYFKELGFLLTSSEVSVEKLEFCSGLFYPVNGTYIYGPKPGRILAKTFWTQVQLNPEKTKQWLRGVVTGLMSDCRHIPLLGPWLHHLVPHDVKSTYEVHQEERRIRAATFVEPDRSTVEFTMARYGLSEDDIQQAVGEATEAATKAPCRLNSDLWARIAEVDNA